MTRLPLLLWLVSAVDVLRGIACIASPDALESNALWPLRWMPAGVAGCLGIASGLATLFWLARQRFRPWTSVFMLAPQFIVLCLGATSGLKAIGSGRYADGTPISPPHIFTDQIVWVLLPVFYGAAVTVEIFHPSADRAT